MPKYRFTCTECKLEVEKYTSVKTEVIQCSICRQNTMNRQLPSSGSLAVTETIDTFTGVNRDQNHDELKKDRKEQYYWDVEVPRFIQTYSTQTCLEEGWLVFNEKGELVINKPPSKR